MVGSIWRQRLTFLRRSSVGAGGDVVGAEPCYQSRRSLLRRRSIVTGSSPTSVAARTVAFFKEREEVFRLPLVFVADFRCATVYVSCRSGFSLTCSLGEVKCQAGIPGLRAQFAVVEK